MNKEQIEEMETQCECEYCKTGGSCYTCTEFYKNIDDRCSGYDDGGRCIEYTPVKYCFNCGRKMRGE